MLQVNFCLCQESAKAAKKKMDEIVFLLVGGGSLHDDGQTLVLSLILLRPSMVVPLPMLEGLQSPLTFSKVATFVVSFSHFFGSEEGMVPRCTFLIPDC